MGKEETHVQRDLVRARFFGSLAAPSVSGSPAGVKGPYCRNTISENVEGKQADLFEEIGIDLDETVGVDYKQFELLMPKKRKR